MGNQGDVRRSMDRIVSWLRVYLFHPLMRLIKQRDHYGMRLAVLIDGENIVPNVIGPVLAEVARFGVMTERRVYGNWVTPGMRRWYEPCMRYGIQPIHTVPAKAGKNATDIALVVDALDLVHRGGLQGVCLVASDSDYTPLVMRLRATGYFVLGIGDSRTPAALTRACTVYLPLERFGHARESGTSATSVALAKHNGEYPTKEFADSGNGGGEDRQPASVQTIAKDDLKPLLLTTWKTIFEEKGTVGLSTFVSELQRRYPDLNPAHHGHKRLAELIRAHTDVFRCIHGTPESHIIVECVQPDPATVTHPATSIRTLLVTVWEQAPKQDGWLSISILGDHLRELDPAFDVRKHGHTSLSQLVYAHTDMFEVRESIKGHYHLRLRRAGK